MRNTSTDRGHRLSARVVAGVLGGMLGVAGLPATAWAAPQVQDAAWDPSRIVAFSDTNFGPDASEYAPLDLRTLASAYCRGTADRTKVRSLGAALNVADRLVAADSHGKGLRAFARSKYGHNAGKAVFAAAGELGRGKPAGALAGFLRAHQLAPRDPVPLIDAAPLLTQAGKGQAALRLLAAASHLPEPKRTPFGVSFAAIAENNTGQALLATHQFARAVTVLNRAVRASSVLRESRELLAAAYMCQHNTSAAGRFLLAGTFRQNPDANNQLVDKRDLNPADVLNTAHGRDLELPTYSYPATAELGSAEAVAGLWGQLESDVLTNEVTPLDAQLTKDQAAYAKASTHWNALTKARTNQILYDTNDAADLVPKVAKLAKKALQAELDIRELELRGIGEAGCLDPTLHGQWLSDVQAYDTEERDEAKAEYNVETAFASNLRNPISHRIADGIAERNALFNELLLIGAGQGLVSYDQICYGGPEGTAPPGVSSGETSTPATDLCPTSIPHFNIKLYVATISVSCEAVSLEVAPERVLGPFINVEHNFKKGQNTIYIGAKGDIGIASAHVGAYVTFDNRGNAVDVGGRATADEGLGGSEPVGYGAGVDVVSAQVGFAGGPKVSLPTDPSPE